MLAFVADANSVSAAEVEGCDVAAVEADMDVVEGERDNEYAANPIATSDSSTARITGRWDGLVILGC